MRKGIILFIIITTFIFNNINIAYAKSTKLKINDNIMNYYEKNKDLFTHESDYPMTGMPSDFKAIVQFSKNHNIPDILFLKINKTIYPIAIIQGKGHNAHFIIDVNGDNILDIKSANFIAPYWIYFPAKIKRGKNKNLIKICDKIYESFQSDDGPYAKNSGMYKGLNMLKKGIFDLKSYNRDILFALLFYSIYNQKYLDFSYEAINLISSEMEKRYKSAHPLFLLYAAETAINLKKSDEARVLINKLLKADPKCIPAQVYDWQLEENQNKANEKYKKLKQKHPKHWIVKQI